MKEHPIIFNSEMVKAILDGRKTQTRRLLRPQPSVVHNIATNGTHVSILTNLLFRNGDQRIKCPCGQPGDRLWARETWAHERQFDHLKPSDIPISARNTTRIKYVTFTQGWHKIRPSIHMPRWASRITLEITRVRCERVKEISANDACNEGVLNSGESTTLFNNRTKAIDIFHKLWDSIYANWDKNPWVWVIEFKKL